MTYDDIAGRVMCVREMCPRVEPVRSKIYPTPYKMEEVINNEIDDMLAKGIIERSEAAYA